MKKTPFIVLFVCSFLSSCSPSEEKSAEVNDSSTAETPAAAPITYPYTAAYSSDWKIGNPENTLIVLNLYKALEENRIDEFDKYLADTVITLSYSDKTSVKTKAEVIKLVKDFRNTLDVITEEFIAFVPLHSNDKNEDWVATWMKERVIRKDGSKDSTTYMETWRFRDNKIYYKGDFGRYKKF